MSFAIAVCWSVMCRDHWKLTTALCSAPSMNCAARAAAWRRPHRVVGVRHRAHRRELGDDGWRRLPMPFLRGGVFGGGGGFGICFFWKKGGGKKMAQTAPPPPPPQPPTPLPP